MIAAAIDKILRISSPVIMQIEGDTYSTGSLMRIDKELRADAIKMKTLSGLVDYIKKMGEERREGRKYIVHVVSHAKVTLISELDDDRKREVLACAEADIPSFEFGTMLDQEKFLIRVQSLFVDGDPEENDKALILRFAGTVKAGTVKEYKDDGISQKAVVKSGVRSNVEAEVPSPCRLAPYRTFTEIDQPLSSFIFRLSDRVADGVCCALYEADGGAWKREAIRRIGEYLTNELKDEEGITVIA